ncbi:hypothetical protein D3C86_972790 [compost metagenome]
MSKPETRACQAASWGRSLPRSSATPARHAANNSPSDFARQLETLGSMPRVNLSPFHAPTLFSIAARRSSPRSRVHDESLRSSSVMNARRSSGGAWVRPPPKWNISSRRRRASLDVPFWACFAILASSVAAEWKWSCQNPSVEMALHTSFRPSCQSFNRSGRHRPTVCSNSASVAAGDEAARVAKNRPPVSDRMKLFLAKGPSGFASAASIASRASGDPLA